MGGRSPSGDVGRTVHALTDLWWSAASQSRRPSDPGRGERIDPRAEQTARSGRAKSWPLQTEGSPVLRSSESGLGRSARAPAVVARAAAAAVDDVAECASLALALRGEQPRGDRWISWQNLAVLLSGFGAYSITSQSITAYRRGTARGPVSGHEKPHPAECLA